MMEAFSINDNDGLGSLNAFRSSCSFVFLVENKLLPE